MTGFFSIKETQVKDEQFKRKNLSCYACGLYKGALRSLKIQPIGNFKKKILIIGNHTTLKDDIHNTPLKSSNRYLQKLFAENGIDLDEDCMRINAVMCYTYDKNGKERIPTAHEIDCCRINIMKIIRQHKPSLIILFGKIPLISVIGTRWKQSLDGIDKWRGFIIPDQELNCWLVPTFSPTFVQQIDRPEIKLIFENDVRNAIERYMSIAFPVYNAPTIHYIKQPVDLPTIKDGSTISFDYETTGLKPHDKGHRIVCCSVAINKNEVYVFPMPKSNEKKILWIAILKNPAIKKMAHNIKFEEAWSLIKLKTRVANWTWDTMQGAHILDNRSGITGLKFQTYVNFGIVDYSSGVSKWLYAVNAKNANSKNRLEEYFNTEKGKNEVMTYCALDSIYQYRLALLQMKLFELQTLPF